MAGQGVPRLLPGSVAELKAKGSRGFCIHGVSVIHGFWGSRIPGFHHARTISRWDNTVVPAFPDPGGRSLAGQEKVHGVFVFTGFL